MSRFNNNEYCNAADTVKLSQAFLVCAGAKPYVIETTGNMAKTVVVIRD